MIKTQTVQLDELSIEVSKLPIGKYSDLLKAIKELPKHVKGLEGKKNDELLGLLPTIIGEGLPDFIDILTIATPLKKEQVEALGLDEITRVVMAVIEINNFKEVYENIKKATARPVTTLTQ